MPKFIYIPNGNSILDFSPYNVWDSEHVNIVGSTTTFLDFNDVGTTHDLSNPTAGSQPTFNATDANFNNKPSFTFNGTSQYVYKSVSDWRGADTSGIIISVFRLASGVLLDFLVSANEGAATPYIEGAINSNSFRFIVNSGTQTNSFRGSDNISDSNPHIVAWGSTASNYILDIDQVNQTLTQIGGSSLNNGMWLNQLVGRDNISIGAFVGTSNLYTHMDWVFSGYFPYVSMAQITEISNFLKSKYAL